MKKTLRVIHFSKSKLFNIGLYKLNFPFIKFQQRNYSLKASITQVQSEIKNDLKEINEKLNVISQRVNIEEIKKQLEEIEKEIQRSDFWQDMNNAQNVMQKRSALEETIKYVDEMRAKIIDQQEIFELSIEENDEVSIMDVYNNVQRMKSSIEKKEMETLLGEKSDTMDCFLEIQSGAGGTESMDWAEMLLEMYQRWAKNRGFITTIQSVVRGQRAGIKHVNMLVSGYYAFGLLKTETGVHRLVRQSPFNADNKRHTSFASVSVYVAADNSIKLDIKESDLKIETMRASGAGGQHVNKTESKVKITHIPTGISVSSQQERSQHQNKEIALKILKSRLYMLEITKRHEERQAFLASLSDPDFGNQIRSYVLHPYQLVKDTRTGVESNDPDDVLKNGNIDKFIKAALIKNIK